MRNDGTPPDAGGEKDNIFAKELVPEPPPWMRRGTWLGLVFVLMVGVFIWLQGGGEDRALSALSPSQRGALFQETQDEFRLLCLADGGGARWPKKCARHAEFLTHFEECDAVCKAEVQPFRPQPTR